MKLAIARLVGKHVAARRVERGWSQERLAFKVGISRQALSMIEHGRATPRWENLYLVAAVLRCEVWDLLPTYAQVKQLSLKSD